MHVLRCSVALKFTHTCSYLLNLPFNYTSMNRALVLAFQASRSTLRGFVLHSSWQSCCSSVRFVSLIPHTLFYFSSHIFYRIQVSALERVRMRSQWSRFEALRVYFMAGLFLHTPQRDVSPPPCFRVEMMFFKILCHLSYILTRERFSRKTWSRSHFSLAVDFLPSVRTWWCSSHVMMQLILHQFLCCYLGVQLKLQAESLFMPRRSFRNDIMLV